MNAKWSREETIIAFYAFCQIPFKDSSKSHPLVIKLANLIGRSPSALNLKIGNIGRLDPSLASVGITGLTHGAKIEQEVWEEFNGDSEKLVFESQRILSSLSDTSIEDLIFDETIELPEGEERSQVIKARINQCFFRQTVLAAYNYHCCISGIGNDRLLEACHIVDWAEDSKNRTNPRNGLCLNPLFHKAYDNNLIGITPDSVVVVSKAMMENCLSETQKDYLNCVNGKPIKEPSHFFPDRDLLALRFEKFKMANEGYVRI